MNHSKISLRKKVFKLQEFEKNLLNIFDKISLKLKSSFLKIQYSIRIFNSSVYKKAKPRRVECTTKYICKDFQKARVHVLIGRQIISYPDKNVEEQFLYYTRTNNNTPSIDYVTLTNLIRVL